MANDLHAVIIYGNIRASIVHEGCAGNPDVTLDTVMRIGQLFREACIVAAEYEATSDCLCDIDDDDDQPEESETIA
jgi:hypothetical protein